MELIGTEDEDRLHRGAGPCRLGADHADYADFSNPARPQKIKLRGFNPERWDRTIYTKSNLEGVCKTQSKRWGFQCLKKVCMHPKKSAYGVYEPPKKCAPSVHVLQVRLIS